MRFVGLFIFLQAQSWENIEYINSLRHSILEAYTGIIYGLTDDGEGMKICPAAIIFLSDDSFIPNM